MAEDIRRKTQAAHHGLGRGGSPVEAGPYIGIVKYNIDPTRSGRVQVYISEFGDNEDDEASWRTVSYASPFFGVTPHSGTTETQGDYVGNRHSYGFWATPPDIGVKVLCIFANGDPNLGFYIACIPEPGLTHMAPGIAATTKYKAEDGAKFGNPPRLPVTEINSKNTSLTEKPRYMDEEKPIHEIHAATMLQQGLIKDPIRGPINSSSQRESPSTVFGVSTPGRPVYSNGMTEIDVRDKLASGALKPQEVQVIGRRGGHTLIMDDGDIEGTDQLMRFRTSKGHQIMMNDSDECIHVIHANGTCWVELGKEGTVDVYGANSVNLRTQGHLNLHADKDVNIHAGEHVNIKGKKSVKVESDKLIQILSEKDYILYSKMTLKVKSDGTIEQQSATTTKTSAGSTMYITGGPAVKVNEGNAANVKKPENIKKRELPEVKFDGTEWKITDSVETIVTRMITHEPYPFHNKGVEVKISLT